jgi:hypothetical protein
MNVTEAAAAARGLEGQPVPPHLADGPLPAGVVSLAHARPRRAGAQLVRLPTAADMRQEGHHAQ